MRVLSTSFQVVCLFYLFGLFVGSAQQCKESETKLDVEISLDKEQNGFQGLYVGINAQMKYDYSNKVAEGGSFGFFELYGDRDVIDVPDQVSICVPSDECLTFKVDLFALGQDHLDDFEDSMCYNFSQDHVGVLYGGETVELQGPFPFPGTAHSFGARIGSSCTLVCSENEVLLILEAGTVESGQYDWYVLNSGTSEVMFECPSDDDLSDGCYWDNGTYFVEQMCLPKDGCYTLLAAERYVRAYTGNEDPDHLKVFYDGELVSEVKNLQYKSVDFGSPSCQAPCANEDESLLELFLSRDQSPYQSSSDGMPELTWSLSSSAQEEGSPPEGNGAIKNGDRSLQYHRECISKSTCMRLDLRVPLTFEFTTTWSGITEAYKERNPYRLVIDGVNYGDVSSEYFGDVSSDEYLVFEKQSYAGNCFAADICQDGESLLDVSLQTGRFDANWNDLEIRWDLAFQYEQDQYSYFNMVFADEYYRFLTCFQPVNRFSGCTEFRMDTENIRTGNVVDYDVSIDGEHFSEHAVCIDGYCEGYTITPIYGQCVVSENFGISENDKNDSVAAIAGSAAVFVLLVVIAYFSFRRSRQREVRAVGPTGTHISAVVETPASVQAIPVHHRVSPTKDAGTMEQPAIDTEIPVDGEDYA